MNAARRMPAAVPSIEDDKDAFIARAPRKGAAPPWLGDKTFSANARAELNTRQSEELTSRVKWLADKEERPICKLVADALEAYFEAESPRYLQG